MVIIVHEHPEGCQKCGTFLGGSTWVRDVALCCKPFWAGPSGLRHVEREVGQKCLF